MAKLFNRLLSKVSLFWRFFILLGCVTAIFLVTLSVSSRHFSATLQDAYLDQARESFEQNCQTFSRELFLAYSLPPAVENCQAYPAVAVARSTADAGVLAFNDVRDSFTRQCALMRLPSESFLYFSRSGLCLLRGRMVQPADNLFHSTLVYEDELVLDTLLQYDMPNLGLHLLPARQVSINGGEPQSYLTLLVPSSSRTEIYGFLYSARDIEDHFLLSSLPPDTSLRLVSDRGEVMFSSGPDHAGDRSYIPLDRKSVV